MISESLAKHEAGRILRRRDPAYLRQPNLGIDQTLMLQ